MNEREAWKYINQLDEMIEWCKCEELKAHYRDERRRVGRIWQSLFRGRVNKWSDVIKKRNSSQLMRDKVKVFLDDMKKGV